MATKIIKKVFISLGIKDSFKKSFFYKIYQDSCGNIFYPFYLLSWKLVQLLTLSKRVNLNGVSLILPVTNKITFFRWFLINNKEPEVRKWVDNHLSSDDVLFDIGGNMALISMYAAKRHPGIKLICFEPEYSNLALIKKNLSANKLQDKIDVYSIALSDFDGVSSLHIQDANEGAAAHTESRGKIDHTDEGYKVVWREGISAMKLDTFLKAYDGPPPTALKIDTDGNELKILTGASELLASGNLKTIIIEMPDFSPQKVKDCSEILLSHSFENLNTDEVGVNQIWVKKGA